MKVRAAVVQAAPVAFDRARTVEKMGGLLAQAARQGAELAVFPEAFVSAYPKGLDFGAVVAGGRAKAAIISAGTSTARWKCPGPTSTAWPRWRASTTCTWSSV